MDSYRLKDDVFFQEINGTICISDFNNQMLYILSEDAASIWYSIIGGQNYEIPDKPELNSRIQEFIQNLYDRKIIDKLPADTPGNKEDIIPPAISDKAVFSFLLEEAF